MEGSFGILSAMIFTPLVFAGLVALRPTREAKYVALAGTLLAAALGLVAATQFNWTNGDTHQLASSAPWIPALGVSLSFAADSVSFSLILLTLLLGPICVACSFTAISGRERTYYAWLLVLQAAMTGVFAARDLVVFYICFEFTLIPMFILISLYGSTNRKKAAIKFFLYTFTGSIIALAGLVYVAWTHASASGAWTFDVDTLERAARATLSRSEQAWVLLALMLGFAVKVPLFPFHTWLPLAHTEAPTAGSVVLAGVLLKLGTYGIYRFVLPMCPLAVVDYAPLIATVSIIGILYGGLICWVQRDVKKLVAYSSVAHLGFCILGMFALNSAGLRGSILYMINHGLSTGALFLLIGMMYERYHTRDMRELGGLAAKMPVWATFMVFFTMASVGLPGLNGFVSEFMCLMGVFQASPNWASGACTITGDATPGATFGGVLGPIYAAVAGVGMIVAAMYLLYMVGRVVWGPLVEPHHHHHDADTPSLPPDLTPREIAILIPLAASCLWLGVYPKPALDALRAPVEQTLRIIHKANGTLPAPVLDVPAEFRDAPPAGREEGTR
ncbi:MAG: NADH-quinone oxidoreductase subunit M [Phycisphaeraceae bacterium]|nr:MAG: NADH-quinone oxidoreductase subunit M [Phycisphaeraceae bacterium]